MLLTLVVVAIILGFITFVFAIEKHSIVYSLISLFIWLIITADALYIEVPNSPSYTDYGLSAFSLVFVFLNLIWTIVKVFELYPDHERTKMK